MTPEATWSAVLPRHMAWMSGWMMNRGRGPGVPARSGRPTRPCGVPKRGIVSWPASMPAVIGAGLAGSRACDGTDAVSDVRPPDWLDRASGAFVGVERCRAAGTAPGGLGAAVPVPQAEAGLGGPGGARRLGPATSASSPPGTPGSKTTPAAPPPGSPENPAPATQDAHRARRRHPAALTRAIPLPRTPASATRTAHRTHQQRQRQHAANQQGAQKTTGQAHTVPGAAATTATPQVASGMSDPNVKIGLTET